MKKLSKTTALCFLGLTVCGKASTSAADRQGGYTRQTKQTKQPAPKGKRPERVGKQAPRRQEASTISAVSALEHFEHELDSAAELLTPFADGTKDPRSQIGTIRETYKNLYPLDEFLTHYLTDHRDELSDDTRQAIGRVMASVTSLELVLLKPEDPTRPHMLQDFISNTLDSLEEVKPILEELEAPEDPP